MKSWSCIVPYQPDIRAALQHAQVQAFVYHDYRRPCPELELLDDSDFFTGSYEECKNYIIDSQLHPLLTPLERVGPQGLRQWLLDTYNATRITRLEDLQALSCLSSGGTASVLDIDGISEELEAGKVTPLTFAELVALYGTDQPTHAMTEQNDDLYYDLGPGEAICFIIYRDGRPDEILFAGHSYD